MIFGWFIWFGFGQASEDTTADHTNFNNALNALNGTTGTDYTTKSEVSVTSAKLTPQAVKVINKKGTELPSTGGIGTTIFYVVGALLVLGAGVLFVTRRRARANEQ